MTKKFLSIKELCEYTGWGESKVRKLVKKPDSTFTVRYGNRLYVDKEKFDSYIDRCIKYQIMI